jgi:glycerol-3-phosphate dehydrogenase
LLCRTPEQAERLESARENERYLPGVELPRDLKVRVFGAVAGQFRRPDLVFLAVPSDGLAAALSELERLGVGRRRASYRWQRGSSRPTGRRR